MQPGATILDPFGGVALGAHDAALAGYQHVSVELEARFVELAQQNIDLWHRRYGHLPQWVRPVCVQGDSRQLQAVLQAQVSCCVSSPPFLYTQGGCRPASDPDGAINGALQQRHAATGAGYGPSPANLGNLPPGSVEAVLASPPWSQSLSNGTMSEEQLRMKALNDIACGDAKDFDMRVEHHRRSIGHSYGDTPGNLGQMASGAVEVVIEGAGLVSTQNPDRMQCSEHSKLSGDSVCQSVKTAESVYHEGHVGACPAAESIVANPSLPVQTAAKPSVAKPADVVTVELSKTVSCSEGRNLPLNIEPSLVRPMPAKDSRKSRRPKSAQPNSTVQPNALTIPTTGVASDGGEFDNKSLSATYTNAFNVDTQVEGFPSITSKMSWRREESGTIDQKTSRHYAANVIGDCTEPPHAHASNAVNSLQERTSEAVSVPHLAVNNVATDSSGLEDQRGMPDTFWHASKQILQQVFNVLRPNGVAIWIVKDYVRDGAIVPFSKQWEQLCHHVGFTTLHEHHAMLVEEHGTQGSFLQQEWTGDPQEPVYEVNEETGGLIDKHTYRVEPSFADVNTARKSFFRRLHEKKRPDLAINHETVYCMQKPGIPWQRPFDPDEPDTWSRLLDAAEQAYSQSRGAGVDMCCSSPPYAESLNAQRNGIDWSRMEGGSRDRTQETNYRTYKGSGITAQYYGQTEGQLGAMPPGTPPSSPQS